MQMFLIREGILDEKGINSLEKQVDDELQIAVDQRSGGGITGTGIGYQLYVFAGSGSDVFCVSKLNLRQSRKVDRR